MLPDITVLYIREIFREINLYLKKICIQQIPTANLLKTREYFIPIKLKIYKVRKLCAH